MTPNDVYIGDWGFFFIPMIGKQKVAFNCKARKIYGHLVVALQLSNQLQFY